MVFSAICNNISAISWRSVLLVKETGGPRVNHRPVASHWQSLSHNVVHFALIEIRTHNISSDSGLQSKLHITEAVLFVMGIELNTIILNGLRWLYYIMQISFSIVYMSVLRPWWLLSVVAIVTKTVVNKIQYWLPIDFSSLIAKKKTFSFSILKNKQTKLIYKNPSNWWSKH
jgi:hypothetical protein